jgi:hypothetical protein
VERVCRGLSGFRDVLEVARTAAEIALDIRQYEGLGVRYLVLDLVRMSRTLEEILQHMEAMATEVWPRIEAGEE